MNAQAFAFAIIATIAASSHSTATEASFRIIEGQPVDISADGAILTKSNSIYSPRYSYLAKSDGTSDRFDAFGGATAAVVVSDDGTIVAGHGSYPESHLYIAWLKEAGESFLNLGTLGGDRSIVRAMSSNGEIVIGTSRDSQQRTMGFRWSEETGMMPVDGLSNAINSSADGISADGNVILGSSTFLCPECDPGIVLQDCAGACPLPIAQYTESFIWTAEKGAVSIGRLIEPDKTPNELGQLPTPQSIRASGISDDGSTVIGTTSGPNGSFIWNSNTGMQPIPKLEGHYHHFYPLDVSADGSVVVGYVAGLGAVIWTPESGTTLLKEWLADEYGLRVPRSFLEQATLVSADGRIVAGHYDSGANDGWWVVSLPGKTSVPEPATALLGGAGVFLTLLIFRVRMSTRL